MSALDVPEAYNRLLHRNLRSIGSQHTRIEQLDAQHQNYTQAINSSRRLKFSQDVLFSRPSKSLAPTRNILSESQQNRLI